MIGGDTTSMDYKHEKRIPLIAIYTLFEDPDAACVDSVEGGIELHWSPPEADGFIYSFFVQFSSSLMTFGVTEKVDGKYKDTAMARLLTYGLNMAIPSWFDGVRRG